MGRTGGCTCKSIFLIILLWILAIAISGCGSVEQDEAAATAMLTDNFSSYSSFPSSPWSVVSGDSSDWTVTTVGDVHAAHFNTASSNDSCLLNSDFNTSGSVSAVARFKIVTVAATGGAYGLYLRATSDLSSYYELMFDSAGAKVYILRAKSGLTTVLNSAAWSVSSNMTTYHTYKFKLLENSDGTVTLSVYIDDTSILSAADASPLTAGYYTGYFFNDVWDGYISLYQITQP